MATAAINQKFQRKRANVGLAPFERPKELTFALGDCDGKLSSNSKCALVGGFGVKAKLECDGAFVYCTTQAAKEAAQRIDVTWKATGGKEPQCHPKASATDGAPALASSLMQAQQRVSSFQGMLEDDGPSGEAPR